MNAITIGLDIAKSVFQVHGEDARGKVVLQKRLGRARMEKFFARLEPCLVGIEACGSSHYWGRTLRALGHEVRLIPAAYVKPFVRRNKTDARDAAAICAALRRPDMRFVAIKSVEQQGWRGLERSRELLVKQHIQLMNCTRSQLAELGIVAAQGRRGFAELSGLLGGGEGRSRKPWRPACGCWWGRSRRWRRRSRRSRSGSRRRPERMRRCGGWSHSGGRRLDRACHRRRGRRGQAVRLARDFAAWCGLTPREHSSAKKRRQGGISRQGDNRLRKLFALGASTVMRGVRAHDERATEWQRGILARRPVKVAVLAQAAKTARIAWAILQSGETYRRPVAAAQRPSAASLVALAAAGR